MDSGRRIRWNWKPPCICVPRRSVGWTTGRIDPGGHSLRHAFLHRRILHKSVCGGRDSRIMAIEEGGCDKGRRKGNSPNESSSSERVSSLNPPADSLLSLSLQPKSFRACQKPGEISRWVKSACSAVVEISSSPQEKVWWISLVKRGRSSVFDSRTCYEGRICEFGTHIIVVECSALGSAVNARIVAEVSKSRCWAGTVCLSTPYSTFSYGAS